VQEPLVPLILIVDDDPDGREMYSATLATAGFRVEEARDGFEANDKGFKLKPHLILMDLLMPRLDGWEVVGWLKKNPATCDIPIVAVTGAGPDRVNLAREAGCESVLRKPCPPDELLAEIHRVLESPRRA
jgi:two-component system cell cycle response regulator DivK